MRVRLAVLPPVAGDGRAWIEVATVGARSLPFAARLLLNVATGKLERASLYALGQAPIELPVGESAEATPAAAPLVRVVKAHAKAIRVAAGTFTATELHVSQGGAAARMWRCDEVPLWGLVRAESGGRTVELLRYGRGGAHSVFPQGKGSESANE